MTRGRGMKAASALHPVAHAHALSKPSKESSDAQPIPAGGRILALDLAVQTGFAYGRPGAQPTSGTIRLKRPHEGPEIAAFNVAAWLRDSIKAGHAPDLVIVEAYLQPAAHRSADSIILQYFLHGAVQALCRCHGIRIEEVSASTIRRHFCGRAHAGDRAETKRMVVSRAKALGYLPRDCDDDDRADALAAWDYACAKFARAVPSELILFREEEGEEIAASRIRSLKREMVEAGVPA